MKNNMDEFEFEKMIRKVRMGEELTTKQTNHVVKCFKEALNKQKKEIIEEISLLDYTDDKHDLAREEVIDDILDIIDKLK